ncbi:MAG: tRNA pseudouridine55 synthase [Miltoncostaeaceae bacterium]|jgi:tRNA pseudouridine55 synthase|nr:tRNA pseudouridine55 synthase [Miltoncostaeaceae bacterium]
MASGTPPLAAEPTVGPDLAPAGVWLVDKPPGPTSHDVVAAVRRRLGRRVRVGHAGTLDPFATGLLVVLVGRATRLAPYLSELDKRYLATVRLGAVSATGDPEGPIEERGPLPAPEAVREALPGFVGRQRQRVPRFAAARVGGERMHRLARRGADFEAPEREIVISRLELVDADPDGRWVQLDVGCSKGTYIRQLAIDLGERLGCGAYCSALRRTAVGHLSLEAGVLPEDVDWGEGIGPRAALAHLPARSLTAHEAAEVAHGRTVPGEGDGPTALLVDGRLVAVARPAAEGRLQPSVVIG